MHAFITRVVCFHSKEGNLPKFPFVSKVKINKNKQLTYDVVTKNVACIGNLTYTVLLYFLYQFLLYFYKIRIFNKNIFIPCELHCTVFNYHNTVKLIITSGVTHKGLRAITKDPRLLDNFDLSTT